MKQRRLKGLGMTLLAGAAIATGVLYLSGVKFFSADFHSLSDSTGSGSYVSWVGHFSFHWPFFVLVVAAFLGLWLLTRSKNENPRA